MLGQRGVNMSYACKICDKSFATSSNRARHEKAFHGTRNSDTRNSGTRFLSILLKSFDPHGLTTLSTSSYNTGKGVLQDCRCIDGKISFG